MSVNSSSSSNESHLHPPISLINSQIPFGIYCFLTQQNFLMFTTYVITNSLLLLPLCIFILSMGLQRRRQRSTSTAAMTSHSDTFTYHMVTMELMGVSGFVLCFCGFYMDHYNVVSVGFCLWSFTWHGESLFHILTCVERYLAVIHPIIYLSLKRERGIRIRNITIGCVWLLCFAGASLTMSEKASLIWDLCVLIFSVIVIFFCSLSVLCVLIRPGPGEQGGGRERVDQSKQRAFYTIMAILGVLLVRCVWNMIDIPFGAITESNGKCVMTMFGVWCNLPGSLVLPLLFLHRAGMLVCWKNNTK